MKDTPATTKVPLAKDRDGLEYPCSPRTGPGRVWTGWLTHREYNVLDMNVRLGVNNIYFFMNDTGPRYQRRNAAGCERMFTEFVAVGLLAGEKTNFHITQLGMALFWQTDRYLLEWVEAEDRELEGDHGREATDNRSTGSDQQDHRPVRGLRGPESDGPVARAS